MKLIRFGAPKNEKPGIIDEAGKRRDCSAHFKDWNAEFFENDGLARLSRVLAEHKSSLPLVPESARHGAPIARPGKVICIGLNFRAHADEVALTVPKEPLIFMKAPNTVVGPYDDVLIPRGATQVDWEVELAVVIGREARYLQSEAEAEACIAGYCIGHDLSERSFQFDRGGQWTKGKSCDTFNPIGPWLSTRDEIADVMKLRLTLEVNGVSKQDGSTGTMIYSPNALVHHLSQFMTLEPGDLINTGTPPGVGFARTPKEFLQKGDVVTLTVEKLGSQRQVLREA